MILKKNLLLGLLPIYFFPARALNPIKKAIEAQNGNLLGLIAQRRSKKIELVNEILRTIEKAH